MRPAQVIVSDDGDPGRTVEEVAGAFPGVLYLRGSQEGLAVNRNTCLAAATAPWIHFVDDDVVIPPTFFAEAAAAIDGKLRAIARSLRELNGTSADLTRTRSFRATRTSGAFSR